MTLACDASSPKRRAFWYIIHCSHTHTHTLSHTHTHTHGCTHTALVLITHCSSPPPALSPPHLPSERAKERRARQEKRREAKGKREGERERGREREGGREGDVHTHTLARAHTHTCMHTHSLSTPTCASTLRHLRTALACSRRIAPYATSVPDMASQARSTIRPRAEAERGSTCSQQLNSSPSCLNTLGCLVATAQSE
eukprot:739338-Rhodomonas_salina.2